MPTHTDSSSWIVIRRTGGSQLCEQGAGADVSSHLTRLEVSFRVFYLGRVGLVRVSFYEDIPKSRTVLGKTQEEEEDGGR